nr:hypothetical protein [Anaerotruncus colihominis]
MSSFASTDPHPFPINIAVKGKVTPVLLKGLAVLEVDRNHDPVFQAQVAAQMGEYAAVLNQLRLFHLYPYHHVNVGILIVISPGIGAVQDHRIQRFSKLLRRELVNLS